MSESGFLNESNSPTPMNRKSPILPPAGFNKRVS